MTVSVDDSHVVYKPSDFTEEEVARGNVLAVAVINDGHLICKKCGRQDEQLETYCKAANIKFVRAMEARISSRQLLVMLTYVLDAYRKLSGAENEYIYRRNVASADELGHLVEVAEILNRKGYLTKRTAEVAGVTVVPTYSVTKAGFDALKRKLGIILTKEDNSNEVI